MLIVSYNTSIIFGHLIVKKLLKNWFRNKFAGDYKFKIVQESVKTYPKTTSLMVWSILAPETIKIVILTLSDMTFAQYYLPSIVPYFVQSFLYALIGTGINHLGETDYSDKSFSNLSTFEKVEFVATMCFIFITIVIFIIFGVIIKRKLKEYKEKMESIEKSKDKIENEYIDEEDSLDRIKNTGCYNIDNFENMKVYSGAFNDQEMVNLSNHYNKLHTETNGLNFEDMIDSRGGLSESKYLYDDEKKCDNSGSDWSFNNKIDIIISDSPIKSNGGMKMESEAR